MERPEPRTNPRVSAHRQLVIRRETRGMLVLWAVFAALNALVAANFAGGGP